MAWPATVSPHQAASAAQYNAAVLAIQTWQGDVSAGGHKLTNCGGITLAANGVLDISAGGSSIKGALAIAADPVPLTVSTAGGPSLQLYTGGGAAHPQLRSSSGQILVTSQAASITRSVRINASEGAEEYLAPQSGRLRVVGSFDVDTDVVAGGKLQGASLNVTTPANITLGANWTNWTPTITASASMTVSSVTITDAQYVRFGPFMFFKFYVSFVLGGTLDNTVFVSQPPVALVGLLSAFSCWLQNISMVGTYPFAGVGYAQGVQLCLRPAQGINFAAATYAASCSGFYRCV
jgi:hypothetical protein